jgi:hypothetical protein
MLLLRERRRVCSWLIKGSSPAAVRPARCSSSKGNWQQQRFRLGRAQLVPTLPLLLLLLLLLLAAVTFLLSVQQQRQAWHHTNQQNQLQRHMLLLLLLLRLHQQMPVP